MKIFHKIFGAIIVTAFVVFLSQIELRFPQSATAEKSSGGALWTEKSDSDRASSKTTFDMKAFNDAWINLAKQTSPAVVNIYTKTKIASRFRGGGPGGPGGMSPDDLFRHFFGNPFGGAPSPQEQEASSLGSGFVINNQGYIVTNNHVINGTGKVADEISVKFIGGDNSKGLEAKVVGVDPQTDVAVIKLKNPPKNLVVLPFGDSDKVQVGEWVIAIGNPYGHSNSLTKGVVSALGRAIDDRSRANFIQTDASINPGNSGGPLINMYGEVVGINTMIDARAQGIGFAIPVNLAKNVVKQIVEKGEVTYGWLGISGANLDAGTAKKIGIPVESGALVTEVFPGEPAEKAGLQPYDVIVKISDRPINTMRDLSLVVGGLSVGAKAEIEFYREKKLMKSQATISKRLSEGELADKLGRGGSSRGGGSKQDPGLEDDKLGVAVLDLNDQIRSQLGLGKSVTGVVVQGLAQDGLAASSGLDRGDVIVEVNRKPLKSIKDFKSQMSEAKDSVLLKVLRDGSTLIVLIELT